MQWDSLPLPDRPWRLQRRVLPQHTDHAGVMWHGAYLAWLEEARVEALASVGLDYSTLSAQGLEMPVVDLALTYRSPLIHGDRAEVRSLVMPRRGVRLPWRSWLVGPGGTVAAEAMVELVLVDFRSGPQQRKLLRRLPPEVAKALEKLSEGPSLD
jgi:acyl-CoA thioester hydrolase